MLTVMYASKLAGSLYLGIKFYWITVRFICLHTDYGFSLLQRQSWVVLWSLYDFQSLEYSPSAPIEKVDQLPSYSNGFLFLYRGQSPRALYYWAIFLVLSLFFFFLIFRQSFTKLPNSSDWVWIFTFLLHPPRVLGLWMYTTTPSVSLF